MPERVMWSSDANAWLVKAPDKALGDTVLWGAFDTKTEALAFAAARFHNFKTKEEAWAWANPQLPGLKCARRAGGPVGKQDIDCVPV